MSFKARRPLEWVFVLALGLSYGVMIFVLTRAKWYGYDAALFDYGKVMQILEGPFTLGVEYPDRMYYYTWAYTPFMPLLFLLWAAFHTPETLMVFQATVLAACPPLLYLLARRRFQTTWLALVPSVLFTISPLVNMNAVFGFNGEMLFVPLFLLLALFVDLGRWRAALLVAVLACFTKVDVLPVLFLFGGYYYLRRRGGFGRRLMALSVGFGALVFAVAGLIYLATDVPPRLGQFHLSAASLSPGALAAGLTSQLVLFAQWLFVPFFAPQVLLFGVVNFVYMVLTIPTLQNIAEIRELLAFTSPVMPLLHPAHTPLIAVYFLALVEGLRRMIESAANRWPHTGRRRIEGVAAAALLTNGLFWFFFFTPTNLGPLPMTADFDARHYATDARDATAFSMVDALPREIEGATTMVLFERTYRAGGVRRLSPDLDFAHLQHWALFDLFARTIDMPRDVFLDKVDEALAYPCFEVAEYRDGFLYLVEGEAGVLNDRFREWLVFYREELSANHGQATRFRLELAAPRPPD
jgi:uncharacterized membrane protein